MDGFLCLQNLETRDNSYNVMYQLPMTTNTSAGVTNVEIPNEVSEEAPEFISNVNTKFLQETGPIECVRSHLKMMVLRGFQGE
ncbi:hypothetical protein E2562_009108 [Oryza meyeriana var. granulata]|uniref:FBD domain-containing protein n=1 Tax=Oryza meyeriana var. granulata TaxID=110450 RepID=A0A6G1D163_9ORYZ|nr:hypothetical protein E2562_009108 [Oryza meyeriana var. granulata]